MVMSLAKLPRLICTHVKNNLKLVGLKSPWELAFSSGDYALDVSVSLRRQFIVLMCSQCR
jgi:hypothetical protein